MRELISIENEKDIPAKYHGTPIAKFLEYHNLGKPFGRHDHAELLVGMCMDNRKRLKIPDNFAYVIRTGGANLRYSEFKISYAIAVGGVRYIAIIEHNNCGMVNLMSKKEKFVQGLVKGAGWDRETAEVHFMVYAPMFEIGNEIDFELAEARRLRLRYPKITIVPMLYRLEDNRIYLINEE